MEQRAFTKYNIQAKEGNTENENKKYFLIFP